MKLYYMIPSFDKNVGLATTVELMHGWTWAVCIYTHISIWPIKCLSCWFVRFLNVVHDSISKHHRVKYNSMASRKMGPIIEKLHFTVFYTITPVPEKQPSRIWVNGLHQFIRAWWYHHYKTQHKSSTLSFRQIVYAPTELRKLGGTELKNIKLSNTQLFKSRKLDTRWLRTIVIVVKCRVSMRSCLCSWARVPGWNTNWGAVHHFASETETITLCVVTSISAEVARVMHRFN